jgi:hypothetical protein
MTEPISTNEQKLNEVYRITIANEARRKSAARLKFFKWIIIFILAYFAITRPEVIMGRLMTTLQPMILSTASGMINTQKADLMKSIKDALPPGYDVQ